MNMFYADQQLLQECLYFLVGTEVSDRGEEEIASLSRHVRFESVDIDLDVAGMLRPYCRL